MALYDQYRKIKIDGKWIGLANEENGPYFCTPVGAKIVGWDNGIHFCFIKKFGEEVFAVNPETCCEYYVYPVAKNFYDFLSLILATGHTAAIEQIILWNKERFTKYIHSIDHIEYTQKPEVVGVITKIRERLNITAMSDPYEYVKDLQANFDYSKIPFRRDFYRL